MSESEHERDRHAFIMPKKKINKPFDFIDLDNRSLMAAYELLNDPAGNEGILTPPDIQGYRI